MLKWASLPVGLGFASSGESSFFLPLQHVLDSLCGVYPIPPKLR